MPGLEVWGRWLIAIGLVIALLGGILWLATRLFPNLSQIPGTLRVQGGGFTCILPIIASIILSLVLTLIQNLTARFLK